MAYKNILEISDRQAFRDWLAHNAEKESECWIVVKRGKPIEKARFYYLDAVEEALCFGWIDSTQKVIDGKRYQRFSPRKKKGNWTELNKERVRRLEKLGLMTDAGRSVLPPMDAFCLDPEIEAALKINGAWEAYQSLPSLYCRVRASNIVFYKKRDPSAYQRMLDRFVSETKQGKTYGEWNDYGRLLDY
jgi:hypothetical protein